MKKIFLTSGIIVCMACPAFATGFNTDPYDTDPQELTQPGACVENVLGVTEGSTVLQARWNGIYHTLTLDTNTAANGWDGTSSVDPTSVYTIEGQTGIYEITSGNSDADYVFGAISSFTDLPTGEEIKLTLDGNDGDDNDAVVTQPNDVARPFKGFFSAQTSGTQYTDDEGALNSAGETAVSGLQANTTWYAQYDCATFVPAAPTRPGYIFAGWYDANDNQVTTFCFDEDTTLYAHWTAERITITWNDNGATTAHTGGSTSCLYGGSVELPTAPSRLGYDFDGWEYINCTLPANANEDACQTQSGNNNG